MSSEIFEMISQIAFILAGISFLFSIFWWFKFHIWGVIEDLTGRTARKEIARIHAENEKNVNFYLGLYSDKKPNKAKEEKITIKTVHQNKESNRKISEIVPMEKKTKQKNLEETVPLKKGKSKNLPQTEVLDFKDKSKSLPQTEPLDFKNKSKSLPQTEVLDFKDKPIVALEMIENIVLIHTEESI